MREICLNFHSIYILYASVEMQFKTCVHDRENCDAYANFRSHIYESCLTYTEKKTNEPSSKRWQEDSLRKPVQFKRFTVCRHSWEELQKSGI